MFPLPGQFSQTLLCSVRQSFRPFSSRVGSGKRLTGLLVR
jgi:hypothetical protein